jgi:hypothetical protein
VRQSHASISIQWIPSLNQLSQKWGQVHGAKVRFFINQSTLLYYDFQIRPHPMSKEIALTAAAVVGVAGLVICWPQAIVHVLRILFPDLIWDIRTSERVVAITFDDGPDPAFTPKVLEILRRYNIKATFFLVGERVRRLPELAGQIRAEGHCLGNHSDSWRRWVRM